MSAAEHRPSTVAAVDDAALISYGRHLAFMARAVESALGDLSMTSYRILVLVAQGDERSSRIAGRLALGRPAVSYAVDTLVEKGLMTRTVDERDRRVAKLDLTDAGHDALADADRAVADYLRPVTDRMSNADALPEVVRDITSAWMAMSAERSRTRRASTEA